MRKLPKYCANYKEHNTQLIQVTYAHMSIGNKSLGETVTNFALVRLLEDPTMAMVDAEHAFSGAGYKIHLTNTKVLIHLYMSKKFCN